MLLPARVALGVGGCLGFAALTGLYLVWRGGWPIALLGALSILAALGYTAGPFPLSYHRLGEVAVFLFFGPVAVVGTYYLQALNVTAAAWVASVPMGALVTAILIVNNFRDIDTDRAVGKRTLAVMLGHRGTRLEYKAMLAAAYLSPVALVVALGASPWVLLTLLSAPIALRLAREIDVRIGTALNATLAGTARLTIYFGGLLAVGLAL
jgi:1,4-dihydroxy-2-naphthoate octaprenyltransferase